MAATFDIKEVVSIITSGQWFYNCCVITCNKAQKDGGKIIQYKKARIARRQLMEKDGAAYTGITGVVRKPNHNQHFTLNIELANNQIKKIHPALVYSINGGKVI